MSIREGSFGRLGRFRWVVIFEYKGVEWLKIVECGVGIKVDAVKVVLVLNKRKIKGGKDKTKYLYLLFFIFIYYLMIKNENKNKPWKKRRSKRDKIICFCLYKNYIREES